MTKPIDVPDRVPTPSKELAVREEARLLEECISELPEKYRESILLRDFCGYEYKRVAEETGRPTGDAARMVHTKALLELERLMRGRGVRD